jgi:Uma2 family endonuclease
MATDSETHAAAGVAPVVTPQLKTGDRLTRAEFERRYEATPQLKKAELIDGVVYVPPPVSDEHGSGQFGLCTWLGMYAAHTPGTRGGDNTTVRLDQDNEPQPDLFLRIESSCGGQSRVVHGYCEGAPELVVEVASSSVSYDLLTKLNVYRRSGVREYVVLRVLDRDMDWFVLREGRYDPLTADSTGLYRSEVFPGLWLDRAAAIRGDIATMLVSLQQGLTSTEHTAFVEKLRVAGAGKQ